MLKDSYLCVAEVGDVLTPAHTEPLHIISCMEPVQSEMSVLVNGKGHDLGDDMNVQMKTVIDEDP